MRHFDPALAQSLIDSLDELSAAARRYPNGLQTMQEEAEAEAARRKAEGATCDGGFIFAGNPKDLPRQRRLMDATRNGDFGPSIEDAIEKYREDTSPETPTMRRKNTGPLQAHSARCSIKPASASALMQPSFSTRSRTMIFACSHRSNLPPPWLAFPHRPSAAENNGTQPALLRREAGGS